LYARSSDGLKKRILGIRGGLSVSFFFALSARIFSLRLKISLPLKIRRGCESLIKFEALEIHDRHHVPLSLHAVVINVC
jgi:hypothetical protein